MIINAAVKVFHDKGYRTATLDDEPHSWPVHEVPKDFWRFCDEGLKVLLGPSLGFEVLRSGLEEEMRMYQ